MSSKSETNSVITYAEAKERGLKYYYPGHPGPKGHVDWRFTSNRYCRVCAALNRDRYRAENPEKTKAYSDAYNEKHRDAMNAKSREYYHNNKEHKKRVSREWKQRNKEWVKQYAKQWVDKNRTYKYYANSCRRDQRRGAEGNYTQNDIDRLITLQKEKCATCHKSLSGRNFHIDHITPITKGGSNWPSNLQLLCPACNISKHNLDPIDWAQKNGGLL